MTVKLGLTADELRDVAAQLRDEGTVSQDKKDRLVAELFALVSKRVKVEEQTSFSALWRGACGWAVIQRAKEARDQTALQVVRVLENPGTTGEVTPLNTPEKPEQALGMVQEYRGQARAQKDRLVEERALRRVTSSEHWDADYEEPIW